MEEATFHHALKVKKDVCIGCAHCMSVCPTQAIRIHEGKANIYNNSCVDCGRCYTVCPVSAITVEEDDFNTIFNYKHRVALVPAVLSSQFPSNYSHSQVFNALIDLGFTHIYEAENAADFLIKEFEEYKEKHPDKKPLISSFCPAIIRLIQVNFPSLVDNIIPVKPPLDIAAIYFRKKLEDEGKKPEDIGMFYVTPCAAKIAAVKSPVGEEKSVFDGVINMNSLFNRMFSLLKQGEVSDKENKIASHLSGKEMLWSLTRGENTNISGRTLAIDGIYSVIEFLEKIENEEVRGIDFVEMRACDESCAGGILTTENKFLAVERLNNRAMKYDEKHSEPKDKEINKHHEFLKKNSALHELKPRSVFKLDEDMAKAMEKMKRKRKIMCFLPGFDCGGCGAPTCQALAEDVVRGYADISHCIFMQKVMERNKKLSPETGMNIIEKIWGKDRLNKDCNKKGADNESL